MRLNRRALKVALGCARHPDASLPAKFDKWAEVKGAYRLLDHTEGKHEVIQSNHWEDTIAQAKESEDPILFIQDGSELLYNNHRYTFGLGLTAHFQGNGMMLHSCLAVRFNSDFSTEVLGLGYQESWVRNEIGREEKESAEEALRIVEIYRSRWLIEEYHKALKSGCRIEECQMRYANRLQAFLGFLGIGRDPTASLQGAL